MDDPPFSRHWITPIYDLKQREIQGPNFGVSGPTSNPGLGDLRINHHDLGNRHRDDSTGPYGAAEVGVWIFFAPRESEGHSEMFENTGLESKQQGHSFNFEDS